MTAEDAPTTTTATTTTDTDATASVSTSTSVAVSPSGVTEGADPAAAPSHSNETVASDRPIFLDTAGTRRVWLRLTAAVTASSGVAVMAMCGLVFADRPSPSPISVALSPDHLASPEVLGGGGFRENGQGGADSGWHAGVAERDGTGSESVSYGTVGEKTAEGDSAVTAAGTADRRPVTATPSPVAVVGTAGDEGDSGVDAAHHEPAGPDERRRGSGDGAADEEGPGAGEPDEQATENGADDHGGSGSDASTDADASGADTAGHDTTDHGTTDHATSGGDTTDHDTSGADASGDDMVGEDMVGEDGGAEGSADAAVTEEIGEPHGADGADGAGGAHGADGADGVDSADQASGTDGVTGAEDATSADETDSVDPGEARPWLAVTWPPLRSAPQSREALGSTTVVALTAREALGHGGSGDDLTLDG